ncbi:MAG: hypothetical protein LAO51_19605, partial [Acidobacteriia bacterium]|nr:hypothetical protein [Terriglobia bacterium]
FGVGTGAVINNSGTWDCQSDASFTNGFGGAATFNNLLGATFKKSAGPGTTGVGITFNNSGAVNVQSGTVNFSGGGTGSGTFTGSVGTTVQFGGNYTLSPGSSVSADAVLLSAGAINGNGNYSVSGVTTITNATVAFNSGTPVGTAALSMSGGILQGTDTVTVSGLTTWTNGTMTGTGTTNANGGMSASGPFSRTLTSSRVLNVAGPTTWTGTGGFGVGTGAVINNSGTWDCQGDASFSNGFGGTATFNNLTGATFKKSAGTGATGVAITFNNSGSVSVQSGTVNFSGGGTNSGTFTGSVGATLQFSGNYTLSPGSSVSADAVLFTAGTVNGNGSYSVSGVTTITSATVAFNSGTLIGTASLSMSGGILQGTDTVTVSGLTTWTSGTMTGAGTTNANGGMSASGVFSRTLTASRILNVGGPTTWSGTGGFGVGTGAVINNSGTWDCQSDASFSNGFGGTATFNNLASGTFKKSAGAGNTGVGIAFNNAGAVQALAANLQFTAGFAQTAGSTTLKGGSLSSSTPMSVLGGLVTGVGTATATVTSAGQTAPGLSLGTLVVSGNYTQSSSGALSVDIGGHNAGIDYDQFNLAGTGVASLAGTLNVSLANGFNPQEGDTFTIMNFASRSGTFGTVNAPALAQGCWLPVYNPTSVVLEVWTTAQEIAGVTGAPDKSTISWNPLPPQSGPTPVYDVMRGLTSEFPVGGKPGETCLVSGTTATSLSDPTVPALGSGFYYLVRGTNACGKGDYGTTSAGAPRNSTACP